ncbi:acyltransferase [Mycetocola sp. 2940]|uniref:acyltransferase n=1 Tax=Mycetocola sp. 2940 TaxID=3156452 RepID=UPI003394A500
MTVPFPVHEDADRPGRPPHIADSADIDSLASIGDGALIWHLVQVRERARIGAGCILGRGAYIGPGVVLGENCKVQNYALIYEPAVLENGVFVGPAAVFTNDVFPRAITPDGRRKDADDWDAVGVTVRTGASIGARAVCIAPATIGAWALIAAGAVVTGDVPDYALVVGVPARRIGWVGRAGVPLTPIGDDLFRCPSTGEEYHEHNGVLRASLAKPDRPGRLRSADHLPELSTSKAQG